MRELAVRRPTWLIEYDASLTGIGVQIFSLDEDLNEDLRFAIGLDLDFGLESQSKYQNTMEFIAIVTGLGILAREGIHNAWIRLRGDSTSSLSWAKKESFKSGPSESAALAFLVLGRYRQLFIEDGDHLKGILNVKCDKLSRGVKVEEMGFPPLVTRRVVEGENLHKFLTLCDPKRRAVTEVEINSLVGELKELVELM